MDSIRCGNFGIGTLCHQFFGQSNDIFIQVEQRQFSQESEPFLCSLFIAGTGFVEYALGNV